MILFAEYFSFHCHFLYSLSILTIFKWSDSYFVLSTYCWYRINIGFFFSFLFIFLFFLFPFWTALNIIWSTRIVKRKKSIFVCKCFSVFPHLDIYNFLSLILTISIFDFISCSVRYLFPLSETSKFHYKRVISLMEFKQRHASKRLNVLDLKAKIIQ